MDNDPKHTYKVVAKWLNKDRKVKVLEWPSYRNFVGRTEKVCASKGAFKPDSVTTSLSRRNGPIFTQLIVGSMWKATRNV
jgi:hypothetical protein